MTKPSEDNPSGQPLGLPLNDQLGPLRGAVDAVMSHQWSNSREAMDALTRLVDAANSAEPRERALVQSLRRLVATVPNCVETYRTNNARKMVLAALEEAAAVLRA